MEDAGAWGEHWGVDIGDEATAGIGQMPSYSQDPLTFPNLTQWDIDEAEVLTAAFNLSQLQDEVAFLQLEDSDEEDAGDVLKALVDYASYGADNYSWQSFLKDFQSAPKYIRVIEDFLDYYDEHHKMDTCMLRGVESFFNFRRALTKDDGSLYFAPTTLRSQFSVIVVFWLHTGRGDLAKLLPIMGDNFKKWEKKYNSTKANCFTKQDLSQLHLMNDDKDLIILKAYSVVAIAFAGRGIEIANLKFTDFSRMIQYDNKGSYKIVYERAKQSGQRDKKDIHCFVEGLPEVAAIDR